MSFNLLKIFHEMDTMARVVTLALLIMGVASLSVFFERLVTYWRSRRQSKLFARIAAEFVARREYHRLVDRVKDFPVSHLARMFSRPLSLCVALVDQKGNEAAATVELVRREVQRQHEEAGADLRRGLGVLASVGSVAPFVGLLGTVVGIIAAFTKISVTGSGGFELGRRRHLGGAGGHRARSAGRDSVGALLQLAGDTRRTDSPGAERVSRAVRRSPGAEDFGYRPGHQGGCLGPARRAAHGKQA